MELNGSLVLSPTSETSEIQNLRVEKVTSNPVIAASDIGRIIYNTTTRQLLVGTLVNTDLLWVSPAVNANVQAEIDAIETALGLNSDGTFDATKFTGNLADQTSYVTLVTELQSLIADNVVAIATEKARAEDVEDELIVKAAQLKTVTETLRTDLDFEVTRAEEAETAIYAAISSEANRAEGAEGLLSNAIEDETSRAESAETALGVRIDTTNTTAEAIRTDLTSEIANRKAGYFLYTGVSNTLHTVTHNIGQKYCTVTVVNANDDVIIPDKIRFVDVNSLTVTLNTAMACKVIVTGSKP